MTSKSEAISFWYLNDKCLSRQHFEFKCCYTHVHEQQSRSKCDNTNIIYSNANIMHF